MSAKIDFSLKPLVAESTGKRLITAVFSHVCDEVGALAECLGTHRAFVRLLSCNRHILISTPDHCAAVSQWLTSVDVGVLLHV